MSFCLDRAKPFRALDLDTLHISPDGAEWTLELREDEPVFKGHYPGNPILPGIYQLEAIIQGVDAYCANLNIDVRLHKVKNMRFLSPLVPRNIMKLALKIDADLFSEEVRVNAVIWCGAVKTASAKLLFLILKEEQC